MEYEVGYITDVIYEELKNKNTKIGQKVFNILNLDLCMIFKSNNVWWVERTSQYNRIPDYFIEYMRKYLKKNYNLTYLYDIKRGVNNE